MRRRPSNNCIAPRKPAIARRARAAAHALKSMSYNVGALRVAELALHVERWAELGNQIAGGLSIARHIRDCARDHFRHENASQA